MKRLLILPLWLGAIASPALSAEYKVRLGGGSAYWGGQAEFAVINVSEENAVSIYHTTNTVDQFWGTGKWWDHEVTASRACLVSETEWSDGDNCINGTKGLIQLPPDANPLDYTYEIKWVEGGAKRYTKFGMNSNTRVDKELDNDSGDLEK